MASLAEMFLGALPSAPAFAGSTGGGQPGGFALARQQAQIGPYGSGGAGGAAWQPVERPAPTAAPPVEAADPGADIQAQMDMMMNMQRLLAQGDTARSGWGGGAMPGNPGGKPGGEAMQAEGAEYPDWFRKEMIQNFKRNR